VKIVETRNGSVTSTKQFVWAGDQLCEERDGSGSVTKRFFAQGEQIGGTDYFYARDHLGSVREMTDSSGSIQSEYNYGPYGEVSKVAGTGPDADMQYAGMYMHQPSGLNLAVNRAYSATQGRFVSRDPISEKGFDLVSDPSDGSNPVYSGGQYPVSTLLQDPVLMAAVPSLPSVDFGSDSVAEPNPYSYANNSPINFVDPTGLSCGCHMNPHRQQNPDSDLAECLAGCVDRLRNCVARCYEMYVKPIDIWICVHRCYKHFKDCVDGCLKRYPPNVCV
jgi:RHS repeat-associated protein